MVSGRLECGSRLTGDGVRLRVRYFGGDDVNRLQHGRTVFFSEKNTAPPMPQASVGTNNCDTGCTEVARNAARIGPKMNTISSMAASSAYAVLSSDSCCEPRSAYAQRVRTRAPNENWVSPMHMPARTAPDGHSGERRQCERKHRHYLHTKRHRSDTPLPEPVEQARVERRDRGDGEDVHGAHRPGDRPVVVHVVEREHDAQRHHRDRQSGHRSGDAERLGAGNAEQLRVRRLRCDGSALLLSPAHRVFSGVPA